MAELLIRESSSAELNVLSDVIHQAFGSADEVELVRSLVDDPSAAPLLSLLAFCDEIAVGHILFTRALVLPETEAEVSGGASILAPLSVLPDFQNQGIGAALILAGCEMLRNRGDTLVFVLGYPDYYRRHGFAPSIPLGYEPPYPIASKNFDAWMVRFLQPDAATLSPASSPNRVRCADALDRPKYWRE